MIRLLLAASVLVAGSGCASTQPATAAAAIESAGPSLAGTEVRCASTGDRTALGAPGSVQVVELWATWCAPCVKALPLWSRLAEEKGIEILAVSIDDERQAPLDFARKHGISLPVLWDPFAQQISTAVPLSGVVPATLVVDCEGLVRHVHEGFAGPQVIDEVAAEVEKLRGESSCKAEAPLARCAP